MKEEAGSNVKKYNNLGYAQSITSIVRIRERDLYSLNIDASVEIVTNRHAKRLKRNINFRW